MIRPLDRETLLTLARHEGYPAVTMMMPTNHTGVDRPQDQLRMKNLLVDARKRLVDAGMRSSDAETFMAEAQRLYEDPTFWRELDAGLAVFVAAGFTEWMKLPTTLPEQVVVGPRFYLRPLMPAWSDLERFYVLAVSQESVRLLWGDNAAVGVVDLPEGTPLSLHDETKFDVADDSLQYRSLDNGGPNTAAIYHGHGGVKDTHTDSLRSYLEHLEKAVTETIGAERHEPLVLAGVDYILDLYQQANTYPSLVDTRISGNADDATAEQLHATAKELLAPLFSRPVLRDLDELAAKTGSDLVSWEISEIVPAAAQGRVRVLFLSDGIGPLGKMDPASFEVTTTAPGEPRYLRERMDAMGGVEPAESDWDLVDLAIAQTLSRDGQVYAFAGEEPPIEGVAALYRY